MDEQLSEHLRPRSFDELALPAPLKDRLKRMYESKNVMNMLFHGKPGTGKTSAALIFKNSELFDAIEINGSLETSVESVRDKVQQYGSSCSLFGGQKLCFIDEADYLSKNAQAGLRGLIETTSFNCRYIFTANSIDKFHPALRSRLLPICFDMTTSQATEELAPYVSRTIEKLRLKMPSIDASRVRRIAELNFPDFRAIANQIEFEFM